MVSKHNRPWNLESFLNSLIFELDKAQDTLSVKGLNRKLTYTVKDVALDLQIFPEYDQLYKVVEVGLLDGFKRRVSAVVVPLAAFDPKKSRAKQPIGRPTEQPTKGLTKKLMNRDE